MPSSLSVPDHTQWIFVKHIAEPPIGEESFSVPGLTGDHYHFKQDSLFLSMIRYSFKDQLVFCAWGDALAHHCSAHALYDIDHRVWQEAIEGCPIVHPLKDTRTAKVIGFSLQTATKTHFYKS